MRQRVGTASPTEPMRELKLLQWEIGPAHPYVIFTGLCFILQSVCQSPHWNQIHNLIS